MTDRSPLDRIRVASPCSANWDEMVGDDRKRFCSACKKDVHDLSAMTTEAALALLGASGEAPCIQFRRRSDGTVMTSDCPVGARKLRHRLIRRVAGVGVVAVAMAYSGAAIVVNRAARMGSGDDPFELLMPNLSGSSFDEWIDWGLVKIGLRKPRVMVRGRYDLFSIPSRGGQPPYDPDRIVEFDCES